MAEITREFVGLPSPVVGRSGAGGHPCQGIYHRAADSRPRTAFIAAHYNIDFAEHYLASHLASRGYGFLGWNTRFRGDGAHFLLDRALADIGVGVRWLREQAGVENVVLLGSSGGGSLMAAYQSRSRSIRLSTLSAPSTARRSTKVSSAAIAPRSASAMSASPIGRSPS